MEVSEGKGSGRYTAEFQVEAVKLELEVHRKSPAHWVRAVRTGKAVQRHPAHPVADLESQNARRRSEYACLKIEREIVRKAAAYFAKDAL